MKLHHWLGKSEVIALIIGILIFCCIIVALEALLSLLHIEKLLIAACIMMAAACIMMKTDYMMIRHPISR